MKTLTTIYMCPVDEEEVNKPKPTTPPPIITPPYK